VVGTAAGRGQARLSRLSEHLEERVTGADQKLPENGSGRASRPPRFRTLFRFERLSARSLRRPRPSSCPCGRRVRSGRGDLFPRALGLKSTDQGLLLGSTQRIRWKERLCGGHAVAK
jgi:hypothetical protein